MKRNNTRYAILLGILWGCGDPVGEEPPGTAVTLTAEDHERCDWAKESMRLWITWQLKGVRLAREERFEEALYCFHEAEKHYPKEVVEDEQTNPLSKHIKHKPEPTDTYIQKASLYLRTNRPGLALIYYEKFESYFPGNHLAVEGKRRAREMLKNAASGTQSSGN